MKDTIKIPVIAMASMLTLFTSCSDDDDNSNDIFLSEAEIPESIQTYINDHFGETTILNAEKETENDGVTYEIHLSDNTDLEFNGDLDIVDIDGTSKLPESVIPEAIRDYTATNYPDNYITDWELELDHQQVELDNHVELEFDMNGDFIRIDKD
ncbi:PepSY-like domain-containing protein [Pseudozobellia thermophila]|uniref:Putative beta-lactamase-inhibitor-like, PepSY-like n=1 Tax=Pseudozobellia thermophila TaxID=192903 RepID=A0A1M6L5G1_9FLAO|nr:PepSY-like domain-containing protein [Pseudozobellia thermophila]SHJ66447.1 Putative beta-lactamase-inhibitor-like, PepSY-like [Pseudozobellia thermophila]